MGKRKGDDIKRAVAMAYRPEEGAPRPAANGSGLPAEAIVARAREQGIYVHNSAELVGLLMQVDLDAEVPPELYRAVAELLAWLCDLDQKISGSHPSGSTMR